MEWISKFLFSAYLFPSDQAMLAISTFNTGKRMKLLSPYIHTFTDLNKKLACSNQ